MPFHVYLFDFRDLHSSEEPLKRKRTGVLLLSFPSRSCLPDSLMLGAGRGDRES